MICIARDLNESLYIFSKYSERDNEQGMWWIDGDCLPLNMSLFPEVTWSNSPVEIELTLKNREQ